VKYLRLLLSIFSLVTAFCWSRLILPLRKEQMPFSGWGDGAGGNATTLAAPVIICWLATLFAFLFVAVNPYVRTESNLTRAGRWLTNIALCLVTIGLLFYAMHGPPVRFFLLYGFIALFGLWIYVDAKGPKTRPGPTPEAGDLQQK
jgi:fumarate reductase subunit D